MKGVNTHNNFYYFTAALVLLLLAQPIYLNSPIGEDHRVLQGVIILTEIVAFFSLNLSKRWRFFVGLMLLLMLLSSLAHEYRQSPGGPMSGLVVALIFYCGMAFAAARQALFTGDIDLNTVIGALAVYLLLGVIWSMLYLLALEQWPAGLSGVEYQDWRDSFGYVTYFSFTTMTTLGYGDISPTVPVTQTLAYLQAITGTFYMAVVVASLVGKVTRGAQHP